VDAGGVYTYLEAQDPTLTGTFVEIDGISTFYEGDGSGEPLLLLHGGMCSAETFDRMIPGLAGSYQVFAPERRGHGRMPDTAEPFSYDAMTVDTVAFMDALGLASAHVIGHSDGANIGLLMAIRHPSRVRRLVSISGNFRTGDSDDVPSRPRAAMDTTADALEDDYRRLSPDGPEHLAVIWAKLEPMWNDWTGIALEALRSITAPTLVMAADEDVIGLEQTIDLYRSLELGQLAIIPNTSHNLIRERGELIDELILDFLADPGLPVDSPGG